MIRPRPTTHHAPWPALRTALFASDGTILGGGAHHLVAEGPLPWRQSATATAVLFGVGLAGVRRPRSLATVAATHRRLAHDYGHRPCWPCPAP
ncbi:hypothetical protein [Streptomyces rishiriensis]|uniref:hypothetical protein n=1 Tax=Streptomyces rishiriensis TaxID=68264 RepID=UPI0015833B3B|nr:hypothetical protein [Streptomyces rishiriensis]